MMQYDTVFKYVLVLRVIFYICYTIDILMWIVSNKTIHNFIRNMYFLNSTNVLNNE